MLRRVLLIAAVAGILLTGCLSLVAETPKQRLYAATADLTAAFDAAATLCESPVASLEQCQQLLRLYQQAETLLAAVEVGLANGTLGNQQAADILRIVAQIIEQMEGSR